MSNNLSNKEVWVVGAGPMAIDHVRVLQHLKITPTVIGRGEASAKKFEDQTGISVERGGLRKFLNKRKPSKKTFIVIAVGSEALMPSLLEFTKLDFARILVEKPAAISIEELLENEESLRRIQDKVFVAYNRRFYDSVKKARQLITDDGGLTSMHFEFTEWSHRIEPLIKAKGVKENWFFANSTHVIDLAFYLAGMPRKLVAFHEKGNLDWHKNSFYSGAGITENDVVFSYEANWESAGSWSIILKTAKRKLILNPLETLKTVARGSLIIENSDLEHAEKNLKEGLFEMHLDFLQKKNVLSNLNEHVIRSNRIFKIINGE
jgi:predicted dehydrogenase